MVTVILLTISNVFMTFAWYGHLKYAKAPLVTAILVSWGIAFAEYCFQVPANRIGHRHFDAAQLKIMQEVITLVVFAVFSVLYLKEPLRWNYIVGFALILAAVFFVFAVGSDKPRAEQRTAVASTRDHNQ
ncbi:MAG: DMT family protein [Planctomycetaceae bacterium]|nr:DMT family protein [Planctomycetaceae bacterium]